MKNLTAIFISKNEKELFLIILFLFVFIIALCSRFQDTNQKIESIKITGVFRDQVGDFDQTHIPNKPPVIAKMISVLKPNFSLAKRNDVAEKIHKAFIKYKIEPQIVVAIIDAESGFNHELVSSTGDLSMAQVNVDVWNKEFQRMNLDLIETEKLKVDQAYSLEVMAKILHILKTRYGNKDRKWYARYHSKTEKHKQVYLSKLDTRLKFIKKQI